MKSLSAVLCIFVALGILTNSGPALAQSSTSSQDAPIGPAFVSLFPPVYPAIARQARIAGEVEIKVSLTRDGAVQSAVVVTGHSLLRQTALDSAQKSKFRCTECTQEITEYLLVYSFELGSDSISHSPGDKPYRVTQSGNRITITDEPFPVNIDFEYISARSPKCLYLWRCGYQWGGMDYFFYRVRSAKCLYAWKCGYARRVPVELLK